MNRAARLLLGALRMQLAPPEPGGGAILVPAPALWLLLATVWTAVLVMIAMLALEIVILVKVFDLVDLIEKLVPVG